MKLFNNPKFFQTNLVLELLLIALIPSFCTYLFLTDTNLSISSALTHHEAIQVCYKIFATLIITMGLQAYSMQFLAKKYDTHLSSFEALRYITIAAAPVAFASTMLISGDLLSTSLAIIGASTLSCYLIYQGLKNQLMLNEKTAAVFIGTFLSIAIISFTLSALSVRYLF